MRSEAQKRAIIKYDKKNIKRVVIKLNRATDNDLIEYIESLDNIQGTLKQIIREKVKER